MWSRVAASFSQLAKQQIIMCIVNDFLHYGLFTVTIRLFIIISLVLNHSVVFKKSFNWISLFLVHN